MVTSPLGTPSARPLISATVIGRANRGRVLQALFDLGPTSRAELARLVGVNRSTITAIVQPLIDTGILIEGEPLPAGGSGGKPARPLGLSPAASPIGALQVMPGRVRAALVSITGDVLAQDARPFPVQRGRTAEAARTISDCLDTVLRQAHRRPIGVGIAVGGMVDTDHGSIVEVNLAPSLSGLALGPRIAEHTGLPVHIDHHPRAMLLGDRWFGPGRGISTFAVIYTGEVLGGAFMVDGRVHRGSAGAGGELGHTFVQLGGDLCRCGRRGCWETMATLGWLRRTCAAERIPGTDDTTTAQLALLARTNADAAKVLDRYAFNLAVGIANLQQTLALNRYVLHGDAVG
ncbi:MAG: ROK family protein, partial [Actinocatenispora sp.]